MRANRKNYAIRRRVAEWVFANRARNDLTQEELAKRIGCTRVTIERIENEVNGASLDMIHEIGVALGAAFTIGGGK